MPDTTKPTPPATLTASSTTSTVTLNWPAATDDYKVGGYHVYRAGTTVADRAGRTDRDVLHRHRPLAVDQLHLHGADGRPPAGNLSTSNPTDHDPDEGHRRRRPTPLGFTAVVDAQHADDRPGLDRLDRRRRRHRLQGLPLDGLGRDVHRPCDHADDEQLRRHHRPGQQHAVLVHRGLRYDAAGNTSTVSNTVSATTPDTIAPTTPTGLTSTGKTGNTVSLTLDGRDRQLRGHRGGQYPIYRDGDSGRHQRHRRRSPTPG